MPLTLDTTIITATLAQRIERCILTSHMENTRIIRQRGAKGASLNLSTGAACFSGGDSFLSQVIGWGFEHHHIDDEINMIEAFYRKQNHEVSAIELCPLAGAEVAHHLTQQGYLVTEFNNVSTLNINTTAPSQLYPEAITVRVVEDAEVKQWAQAVCQGFGCPEAKQQFIDYASMQHITAFAGYIDGQLAGGGTIAVVDGICDLGVTSTLPTFRGHGLQKALIAARLEFATKHHATLATVTTAPGSISDLNIQKCGFRCAYTRIKLEKELH